MILNIDIDDKEFVVTREPEAKLDQVGNPRLDKQTQAQIWVTQVVVTDESGGEIIRINTSGDRPDVQRGELVEVQDLVATPWSSRERSGVAFVARSIKPAPL